MSAYNICGSTDPKSSKADLTFAGDQHGIEPRFVGSNDWLNQLFRKKKMREDEKRESIEVLFRDLRFGKQHLGLGDIHLTIAEQEELIDAILAVMARYCVAEREHPMKPEEIGL